MKIENMEKVQDLCIRYNNNKHALEQIHKMVKVETIFIEPTVTSNNARFLLSDELKDLALNNIESIILQDNEKIKKELKDL